MQEGAPGLDAEGPELRERGAQQVALGENADEPAAVDPRLAMAMAAATPQPPTAGEIVREELAEDGEGL